MAFNKRKSNIKTDFNSITISLASPESILNSSEGEVTQPETINYRTYKPEMGGLFCERIFGPVKDWECHCGKYKRIRYKGIVCDRCGVEVTEKKVRRDRMGHIQLVVPVAHIWYFRSLPNKIGYLLGLPAKKLDQIIYYERYIVVQSGIMEKEGIEYMQFLSEDEYLDIIDKLPRENQLLDNDHPDKFIAKMGAEGLEMLLSRLDLKAMSAHLRDSAANETSQQRKAEALKRLRVIEGFRDAQARGVKNNPEWMIIKMVPVIPPELRPLVPLDGGRFATSDLNDLYRRVIIRNNRLKRLMEIKAPEVILRNEKRMLQEAVDSLFDNSRKVNAVRGDGNRALKSLSDMLKGKQGRFRQNLLGKRVDYSGRSVIVVGPNLKLHECGLPKGMAAELFKPFVIRKLIERGVVKTVKSAKKIVDRKDAVIWDILENVLKGHPVMLNRAPTLHRLGIQAFQPKLIEGKAIQLHPLVCSAFNADFDGDQMAVHLPLGHEAVLEASVLMLASHNILSPANGEPIAVPSQDMVLGLYYLTKGKRTTKDEIIKGEGMKFYSRQEVIIAMESGILSKHAHIKVRTHVRNKETGELELKTIDTVAGRAFFNECVPEEVGYIDELLSKKALRGIIGRIFKIVGMARTADFLDDIKFLGFQQAYRGGLSIGIDNVKIPEEKQPIIAKAKAEVAAIRDSFQMGLITNKERYNKVIDIWTGVNSTIASKLLKQLEEDDQGFNSVYMMMHSGARGSREQIRQLGGMRGLMAKPQKSAQGSVGEIIENPILSNFKEGLDVIEYFISTHGARKGLADTALKTADAGYLTRRLVDVAQDVVVVEMDCGTLRGITATPLKEGEDIKVPISHKVLGRTSLHDVFHPKTGELIVASTGAIDENIAEAIELAGIEEVEIRSVLTCETRGGTCSKCYGRNLATGNLVQNGEAVGVIAAQSIGEPGTQLTLRTFHSGGVATNVAAESNVIAKIEGKLVWEDIKVVASKTEEGDPVDIIMSRAGELRIVDEKNEILFSQHVPYGSKLYTKSGKKVKEGDLICDWDPYNGVILAQFDGVVEFEHIIEDITFKEEKDDINRHSQRVIIETKDKTKNPAVIVINKDGGKITSNLPAGAYLIVKDGQKVKAGEYLVKIPRSLGKNRDITGGLPRVTELFEARNPSNPAVVSEIDGIVSYGGIKRGNREIFVESQRDGIRKKYMVQLSKHILVQENDFVRAGEPLSDGAITPADILAIKGPTAVQEYLVNEIQDVYRQQGVTLNDKHIEIIVRQMMQKVQVRYSGDTNALQNQVVDKFELQEANDDILDKKVVIDSGESEDLLKGSLVSMRELRDENSRLRRQAKKLVKVRDAQAAVSKPTLKGITQASLTTKSFISAASFQETTKVLSEASISGKQDFLQGLKENVIVGHLIPAGTGQRQFRKYGVYHKDEYNELIKATEKSKKRTSKDVVK